MLEQSTYNDLEPTIFSPTGRLHPVERTMEQVRESHPRNNLVVALQCQDGMLMLSTVTLSPYLNTTVTPFDSSSSSSSNSNSSSSSSSSSTRSGMDTNTSASSSLFIISNESSESDEKDNDAASMILPIVDLTPGVLGATAGQPLDSQVLRLRLQSLAHSLVQDDLDQIEPRSDSLSVSKLARQLADQLQVPTQRSNPPSGRLLAVRGRDLNRKEKKGCWDSVADLHNELSHIFVLVYYIECRSRHGKGGTLENRSHRSVLELSCGSGGPSIRPCRRSPGDDIAGAHPGNESAR